jgi:uncharacterized membrane protein
VNRLRAWLQTGPEWRIPAFFVIVLWLLGMSAAAIYGAITSEWAPLLAGLLAMIAAAVLITALVVFVDWALKE